MLSNIEIEQWYMRLNLSNEAQAVIHQIRTSQPARSVQSFKGNVSGRYPSRKMGVMIQFESHKNELAFIYEYEHDDDVLEYYDQPPSIKLIYEAVNGRRLGVWHTTDYFVIRQCTAGWEECKLEERLIELASKNPNRYGQDSEGKWRCPPGEITAEEFKLYYRIRSSKEINWNLQRNIEFLDDYYRRDAPTVASDSLAKVLIHTNEEIGLTLEELFRRTDGTVSRDVIYNLIASSELYVNLNNAPLTEPSKIRIFPDRETAVAFTNFIQISPQDRSRLTPTVNFSPSSVIQWDGKGWIVVNIGERKIGLIGEDNTFAEIPIPAFEKLVREGTITGVAAEPSSTIHSEAKKRIEQADKNDYKEANRKFEIVRAFMSGESLPTNAIISDRTLRDWAAKYRKAQEAYGNGYVGLLPCKRIGNTKTKLPAPSHKLISEFIENDYETLKQKSKFAVYSVYRLTCERRGVIPASYKTFCLAVKKRPRYKQTLKRQGRKAAYADKEFYWELTSATPRHGERPLHIVHIDHTELDAELVCSLTGQDFGRAWATFLTDAFSRRLAVYVTYDPPSYRSSMMIFRECVRRFGRMPQIVVVDGGRDFSGTYFDTLLARFECIKKIRPPAEGHFGSVSEKLFDTNNTQFMHNLQGNTQIMRNVRQVYKSINPKENALWTLELIYLFLREWAYEVYDTIEHPALGQCPRDAFARGMVTAGERAHRLITYSDEFRLLTLPTTRKGTAKVLPGKGVKINNFYYWSDIFRRPEIEGTRVNVRYDPFNMGLGFAYVRGEWTECHSEYYTIFRDRTEREIMLATAELRKRSTHHSRQFNVTAVRLAHFLESVEAQEILFRQQTADREACSVLRLINNEVITREPNQNTHVTPTTTIEPLDTSLQQGRSLKKAYDTTKLKVYGEF
jgi:putative transposase